MGAESFRVDLREEREEEGVRVRGFTSGLENTLPKQEDCVVACVELVVGDAETLVVMYVLKLIAGVR